MMTLFIDTSLSDVSIVLVRGNEILGKVVKSVGNLHSVYDVEFIKNVLDDAGIKAEDVDVVMVVNGPGSFTGIRIGVTIAKVYAYLLKKDLIMVSSLRMLALSSMGSDYYLSLISARHDNYYAGLYDRSYNIIFEKFVNRDQVKEIVCKYKPQIVVGEDLEFDGRKYKKCDLDYLRIVLEYGKDNPIDCHLAVGNYLKLPQALEEIK